MLPTISTLVTESTTRMARLQAAWLDFKPHVAAPALRFSFEPVEPQKSEAGDGESASRTELDDKNGMKSPV